MNKNEKDHFQRPSWTWRPFWTLFNNFSILAISHSIRHEKIYKIPNFHKLGTKTTLGQYIITFLENKTRLYQRISGQVKYWLNRSNRRIKYSQKAIRVCKCLRNHRLRQSFWKVLIKSCSKCMFVKFSEIITCRPGASVQYRLMLPLWGRCWPKVQI